MSDRLEEIKKSFYVREDDMKWLIAEVERLRDRNEYLKSELEAAAVRYVGERND
ncbi:hypothetical protein [Sporolactobacillus sp. KGMB 08714]|uniref:hypothetical protein n=1 Tax=Sporolactobacillus sp. KGMB 08714 TaxID=3064704 RepID=UPI002FBEC424